MNGLSRFSQFCVGIGVVLALVRGACAYEVVRRWDAFRQEDGLAHSAVMAIAQTRDGDLWFATFGGGISRYDGRQWQTYGVQDGVPGNAIGALHTSADGTLWAAAAGGMGNADGPRLARWMEDRWTTVGLPDRLRGARIQQITELGDGALYLAAANGGILRYDGSAWEAVTVHDGLAFGDVRCLLRSDDGAVWAAYGFGRGVASGFGRGRHGPAFEAADGVSRRDPVTRRWSAPSEHGQLSGKTVLAMAQAADGAIWFGTWRSGVFRYDGHTWQMFTTAEGLPSNRVHEVAAGPDGSVWVGTPTGAARYDHASGKWTVYTEADGLPSNNVMSLIVARDGSVWAGTQGGVARYRETGWVHYHEWRAMAERGGAAMARDGNGRLWISTGEAIYRMEADRWEAAYRYAADWGRAVGLKSGKDGELWGAKSGELVWYDGREWHSLHPPAMEEGGRNPIQALFPSTRGGVWVGTRTGAYYYDGRTWTAHPLGEPSPVIAIMEADDGALWFGLENGVVREADGEQQRFTSADGIPRGPVIEIVQTGDGTVWVSSLFEGLARYNGQTWRPGATGSRYNGIRRIYLDKDGMLWLASMGDGAVHTDGQTWVQYGVQDGLPSSQVWDICQDASGRFWFVTDQGLASYALDDQAPDTQLIAPPDKVASYQSVLVGFSGQDPWDDTPTSALSYSWRLDGEAWSPFDRKGWVRLDESGAGLHRLEVRAMDRTFNVDPSPALHAFTVLAPVWQQPWFVALSLASLAALMVSSCYAIQRNRRWRAAQAQIIKGLEAEMQKAHDLQMGLLPTQPMRFEGFEIAGRCAPANHVGGDYYSYFWLEEPGDVLGFGAADVSGKAMEAAVRVMQLSGFFHYEFRSGRPPLEVLKGLHETLKKHLDMASFVTCCIGTLDVPMKRVRLANAAHTSPYHYLAESGTLRAIEMASLPLGITLPPEVPIKHVETEVEMHAGDLLVLYSDGVTDTQNEAGDFYEEGRLEAAIRQHAGLGAEALVDALLTDLKSFEGMAPQVDDITLLVLRALPQEHERSLG